MSHEWDTRSIHLIARLPALIVPVMEEPTAEELERRQRLIARARTLREDMHFESGQLQVSTDVIKHEARQEEAV